MATPAPTDAQADTDDQQAQPTPDAAQEVVVEAQVHKGNEDYPLDEAAGGVAPEDQWEEEEEERGRRGRGVDEELAKDDEDFENIIQEQVKAGHLKKQVQAGNCRLDLSSG